MMMATRTKKFKLVVRIIGGNVEGCVKCKESVVEGGKQT
jgi:hypothetical protein